MELSLLFSLKNAPAKGWGILPIMSNLLGN
jgi:hypothetical protein